MNESIDLVRILGDLHRFFNERFFDGKLPKPIITISAEGRKREGSYSAERWQTQRAEGKKVKVVAVAKDGHAPDEISIHSELGLNRPFVEVAAILAHQMVHQAQEHHPEWYGEPGKHHYHNSMFHDTMSKKLGLRSEGPKGELYMTPMFEGHYAGLPRAGVLGCSAPERGR